MTIPRVTKGVPNGGEFTAYVQAESDVTLAGPAKPTPARPAPRVPTDREILDSIAIMMAESADWDADMTDGIGNEIARSGRPHPGETILTDAEVELIEDRGDFVDEANGRAYQSRMYAKRAEAAAAPMRVDPTDTIALLEAHATRAYEADQAVQLTAAKALAQVIKKEWPEAAYLQFDASESNGTLTPNLVLDEDFNEIADNDEIQDVDDIWSLTTHLTDRGSWTGYREYAPENKYDENPCLGLNEIANLDLASVGAGPAPRAPEQGETFYTGQESKVTGHFGSVVVSPRDGEPGTIIMIDTSEGRGSEPAVIMINDEIYDIPE